MRFERFRRVRYLACAGIGVLAAATIAVLAAGGASGAPTTSRTLARFSSAGTYVWTVPAGVSTVTFDVFGASGGDAANGSILVSVGGAGGEAKARFAVTPGRKFEIVVGGRGSDQLNGGFNGGGGGGSGGGSSIGAGGGGGSDVRLGGLGNACAIAKSCSYSDRIVVGGGGGGGGQAGDGGAGGGASGKAGPSGGGAGGKQEGTITSSCFDSGGFGCGGEDFGGDGGGGGGGGWYGGDPSLMGGVGGGGGSGVISRLALSGSFPGGTRNGDGLVVINTP